MSIARFLCEPTNRLTGRTRDKLFDRHILYSRSIQIVSKKLTHTVPQNLIENEKQWERFKIDPKVTSVRSKLLYSEYLHSKSLRFGYEKNKMILKQMKERARHKRYVELVEKPAFSVALKYLTDTPKKDTQVQNSVEDQVAPKSIHMPYAATDQYEKLKEPPEIDEYPKNPEPVELNEEYKALYEKYLLENDGQFLEETLNRTLDMKNEPNKNPEKTNMVPSTWMTDYEQYDENFNDDSERPVNGTPNPKIPVSSVPCGGCGALLHCKDPAIPGYLPSELFQHATNEILNSSVCQRCHFIRNYNTTLEVKVSPEDYPVLLGHIKKKKVAVILVIDLMDFPCSIWPGIMDIIGKTTQVFVVGNKVDLLPKDGPNFLENIERSLLQSLNEMGIGSANIKGVSLISAKTGYGVERFINKLHKIWAYKGDIYMIGCTNVGKSSIFNILLGSDYCKIQASNLIQRATISPWPGTTLNLLKFPISNPVRWRLWMRTQRLIAQRNQLAEEEEFRKLKFKETRNIEHTTLTGYVGQTFDSPDRVQGAGFIGEDAGLHSSGHFGVDENDEVYKESRWCFDTPGSIHPDQVLHLLTTEELMLTIPQRIISPRTYALERNQTLFLAGLGRLDFLGGSRSIRCTVFASRELPVAICKMIHADKIYEKLLESEALRVPVNDPERLKVFPALEEKTLTVTGIGTKESAADIILSSAGWVAITAKEGRTINLRAWTPQGRGIYLRTPALLSRSIAFVGHRIENTPAFRGGRQVYSNS